jgi:hypothetical protein
MSIMRQTPSAPQKIVKPSWVAVLSQIVVPVG